MTRYNRLQALNTLAMALCVLCIALIGAGSISAWLSYAWGSETLMYVGVGSFVAALVGIILVGVIAAGIIPYLIGRGY